MSDLDEAIAALQQAVARLEAMPPSPVEAPPPAPAPAPVIVASDPRIEAIAAELADRVDAVLARLDRILAEEE